MSKVVERHIVNDKEVCLIERGLVWCVAIAGLCDWRVLVMKTESAARELFLLLTEQCVEIEY